MKDTPAVSDRKSWTPSKASVVGLIVTTLFAISIFGLQSWERKGIDWNIIPILLFVLSFVVSVHITLNALIQDLTESRERTFLSFREYLHPNFTQILESNSLLYNHVPCLMLGSTNQGIQYILAKMDEAESIRDTFIVHRRSRIRSRFTGMEAALFIKLKARMESYVKDNGRWDQIISYETGLSANEGMLDFCRNLYQKNPTTFSARVMDPSFPIINFTIIEYRGALKQKEVLFEWGHHEYNPSGNVFLSRDKDIIEMYEKYWTILEEESLDIESIEKQFSYRSISGLWFVVATHNKTVRDVAVVDLIVDSGVIRVDGHAYSPSFSPDGTFHSMAADIEPDRRKLWFVYSRTKLHEGVRDIQGSTCYHFLGDRSRPSRLIASFFDDGSEGKIQLDGERVDDEDDIRDLRSKDLKLIQKILRKYLGSFYNRRPEIESDCKDAPTPVGDASHENSA